jgi:RNA polymerase sigma-70 factor, ECF subfamily
MLFLILSVLVSPQDDRDLVKRLKQRDPNAMNELYDRFGRLALSVILRIVRDHATAEDLLQETFLRVWNRISVFDGERGSLGPWVLTIARNRAIDYLRSTDSRYLQTNVELENPKLYVDLEEQYVDQDRIRQIRSAFTKLTDNQKRVLEMAYFEGLSQSEMAEQMNQPLGTVKTWVRTALQILRQELGEAVGAPDRRP